jgi:mRNA-degrading endonuclease RelE of RelBE toxin-antitoxin system
MTVEFHRKFSKDLAKISKDEVPEKIKDVILHWKGLMICEA